MVGKAEAGACTITVARPSQLLLQEQESADKKPDEARGA
jgi:hypothetical protein